MFPSDDVFINQCAQYSFYVVCSSPEIIVDIHLFGHMYISALVALRGGWVNTEYEHFISFPTYGYGLGRM